MAYTHSDDMELDLMMLTRHAFNSTNVALRPHDTDVVECQVMLVGANMSLLT